MSGCARYAILFVFGIFGVGFERRRPRYWEVVEGGRDRRMADGGKSSSDEIRSCLLRDEDTIQESRGAGYGVRAKVEEKGE